MEWARTVVHQPSRTVRLRSPEGHATVAAALLGSGAVRREHHRQRRAPGDRPIARSRDEGPAVDCQCLLITMSDPAHRGVTAAGNRRPMLVPAERSRDDRRALPGPLGDGDREVAGLRRPKRSVRPEPVWGAEPRPVGRQTGEVGRSTAPLAGSSAGANSPASPGSDTAASGRRRGCRRTTRPPSTVGPSDESWLRARARNGVAPR